MDVCYGCVQDQTACMDMKMYDFRVYTYVVR